MKGVQTIDIDTWLQVIPQLIARIDHPRKLVSRLIDDLLTAVGKQHPQVRNCGAVVLWNIWEQDDTHTPEEVGQT